MRSGTGLWSCPPSFLTGRISVFQADWHSIMMPACRSLFICGKMPTRASSGSEYWHFLTGMAPGLSSLTTGAWCLVSPGGGIVWGTYLSPKPQGIVGSALSLDCLTHLASLPKDHAASIHLEGLPRGKVNRWSRPLENRSFLGGKVTCAPNLDKSLHNRHTGHSGIYRNSWVTWFPPPLPLNLAFLG